MPLPALPRRLLAALLLTVASGAFGADTAADRAAAHLSFQQRIKDTLRAPQWFSEGERFIYWSATGPDAGTWVAVDAATGKATPLIAPQALASQLQALTGTPAAPLYNPQFVIDTDQRSIVFSASGQTYALAQGTVTPVAASDRRAWRLSPNHAFAPDGGAVAISEADGGWRLRAFNGKTLARGRPVDGRQWDVPPHSWSPDTRNLLVWQNDQRGMHKLPLIDYSYVLEKADSTPYAKVGTPLARQSLFAVHAASGRITRLATPADEGYMWVAAWRADASEALVMHLSRDGKRLRLFGVPPSGARARLILSEERPASFVGDLNFISENWQYQVTPLGDREHFLWLSERDGSRQVYLYNYDGKLLRQVSHGALPVRRVAAISADMATAYLIGAADASAPADQLLLGAGLRRESMATLSAQGGTHRIGFSPSKRYYTDGHSTLTEPRSWSVHAVDGGSTHLYARADTSALGAIGYAPPEAVRVKAADGVTELHGLLYRPHDFDPRKRYAVIDVIYGAPFTASVTNSYAGSSIGNLASALAQTGFVTLVLDARGTPGRGKAFHDTFYGRIGQGEIADHVGALRQLAQTRPWMDLARAGIHGHSWGGYFAVRGMLTAPEFFQAGYAGAPGALEEEAVINEPNMGLRSANPEGYRLGANEALAGQLRGQLKIMHGTADVNAPFSTTMRLTDAFIKAGKQVQLLVMPGEGHSPQGAAGRYYFDDVSRFFEQTLGAPQSAQP
jgi:dipeptidyl aminopeptidase/acylaminoacyl peptidase